MRCFSSKISLRYKVTGSVLSQGFNTNTIWKYTTLSNQCACAVTGRKAHYVTITNLPAMVTSRVTSLQNKTIIMTPPRFAKHKHLGFKHWRVKVYVVCVGVVALTRLYDRTAMFGIATVLLWKFTSPLPVITAASFTQVFTPLLRGSEVRNRLNLVSSATVQPTCLRWSSVPIFPGFSRSCLTSVRGSTRLPRLVSRLWRQPGSTTRTCKTCRGRRRLQD